MEAKPEFSNQDKKFFSNTFYSFLNYYTSYIFLIVSSFLMARIIEIELWGYLILANSFIQIVIIIQSFLPPSLNISLTYYVSKYSALSDNFKLKMSIKYAILMKILYLIPIYILSLIIFNIFLNFFKLSMKDYTYLLFILSPLIIITGLDRILISINQAFNLFKLNFYLVLIRNVISILILLTFFLNIFIVQIEFLAFLYVFSPFISFLLNFIILTRRYKKLIVLNVKEFKIREFLNNTFKYGINVRLGQFFSDLWIEIQNQSIGIFSSPTIVTGFNISKNFSMISSNIPLTFSSPLLISFTKLNSKKKESEINLLYNTTLLLSLFLLLFVTGILFFSTEFFLLFGFGQSYVQFSSILKIMLFSTIFLGLGTPFEALMLAINKTKFSMVYRVFAFVIRIPVFLIIISKFDLLWAYFGLIFCHFIIALFALILSKKEGKIKLNLKKIFYLFLTFFITFTLTLVIDNFFFKNLITSSIFRDLNLESMICFILLFIVFILIFKIFSVDDIEYIKEFFKGKSRLQRLVFKCLNLLKKILRE